MHQQFTVTRTRIVIFTVVCVIASVVAFESRRRQAVPAAVPRWDGSLRMGVRSGAGNSVSLQGEDAVKHLKLQGEYESLSQAMTTASYSIDPVKRIGRVTNSHDEGVYEAVNTKQALRAIFTGGGVRMHSSGPQNWQLSLRLQGYGYGKQLRPVRSGAMKAQGNRIEISKHTAHRRQSSLLTEWYENKPDGLDQGFTLSAPPARDSMWLGRERLRLTLALVGDLHGQVTSDGRALQLKDRNGREIARYDQLKALDARGRELAARMRMTGSILSLEVDDTKATYPITIDPTLTQEVKLTPGGGAAFDKLGWSIATSGSTAIVGAINRGAAYIFVRNGATWSLQQKLPTVDAPGETFGQSVAISGNTVIVGATAKDGRGVAYVFVREGTTWSPEGTDSQGLVPLTASDRAPGDQFGYSVAISGDTVVVGAPFKDSQRGAAYIFVRRGDKWSMPEQAKLLAANGEANDGFGWSVGISGETVIVGAFSDKVSGNPLLNEGSAYIFVRSGTNWSPQAFLTAPNDGTTSNFGWSVGVSDNTAIVGTHPGTKAFVFTRSGTSWSSPQSLIPNSGESLVGDGYGESVAISGGTAVVGAYATDQTRGAAYVFRQQAGNWVERERLTASDAPPQAPPPPDGLIESSFGFSVAISGETSLIGAPAKKVDTSRFQGGAYVFQPLDTDSDGLPDEWEKNGITVDAAGLISIGNTGNGQFINLPAMGADPLHKDIFVHADWMGQDPSRPTVVFKPKATAIKKVIDSFRIAPVDNPDHKQGINLHVDLGPGSLMNSVTGQSWGSLSRAGEVGFQQTLGFFDDAPGSLFYNWSAVDTIKQANFAVARRSAVFHFVLFANNYSPNSSSGISRGIPSADFIITLGDWSIAGGTENQQAGTFMHEFGHNLGLLHGGADVINNKPNYLSIMNYSFQMEGLLNANGRRGFDYSRTKLDDLDEFGLNENIGINDPAQHFTLWSRFTRSNNPLGSNKCLSNDNYYKLLFPSRALDWDCDGVRAPVPYSSPNPNPDINDDGTCVVAAGSTLNSVAAGDDERRAINVGDSTLRRIVAGPNHICESLAVGGDKQTQPINYVEPSLLKGFKDWPALVFDGAGKIGNAAGISEPDQISTRNDEPTMDQILAVLPPALLDEELVAPLDVVTLSPQFGAAPLLVSFDGSASTAVNGTIVDWSWDFGDGATGSGAMVTHTYNIPGEYFARLSVTDNNGLVNLTPLLNNVTVGSAPSPTPTPTATPLPNLTPYQPTGWADKLVVSKVTGTNTDNTPLLTGDALFVDLATINNGNAATSPSFSLKLYVDGVQVHNFAVTQPLNPSAFVFFEDFPLGSLSVGQHAIRIVVDGDGEIAESDETDNDYTKVINVTQEPAPVSQTYMVKNTNDSGPDSLRQALLDANSHPNAAGSVDQIVFNLPGAGVQTITPATTLPSITEAVLIDGYTQPGASANTLAIGNNAVLLIELNMGSIVGSIGLNLNAGGTVVRGLVINRFGADAIRILSDNSVIEGCFIGTNAAGDAAATQTIAASRFQSNPAIGVYQGNNNRIGGTNPAERNLIVGGAVGIGIGNDFLNGVSNTLIQGNYIGTNAAGGAALNNQVPVNNEDISGSGIIVQGIKLSNTTIGGTQPGAGNLISGNGIPNAGSDCGILVVAQGQFFGSPPLGDLIIQGNLIGTNATGTTAIPNADGGINFSGAVTRLVIGGPSTAARNVISGNGTKIEFGVSPAGIKISADTTAGILVQGNYIGTGIDGTTLIPNRVNGIEITPVPGKSYTIGGVNAGEGNIIAGTGRFNGLQGNGVQVLAQPDGSAGAVSILGNSILGNEGLGIDLVGFPEDSLHVTANDSCDADSGPNNLQNFPVLASAVTSNGGTNIIGSLNSKPGTSFRIEIFANAACNGSGHGEGQAFLSSTIVTTDGSCNASINTTLPIGVPVGQFITATATDPSANTSEFSVCVPVTGLTPTPTPTPTPAPTPTQTIVQFSASNYDIAEDCTFVQLTVLRTGDTSSVSTVDFANSDGSALQRTDYTISSGTVTFAAGETSKDFAVLITQDHYLESAEQFSVTLSSPVGASLGNHNVATVTISDDDIVQTLSPTTRLFGGTLGGGQETQANVSAAHGLALLELSADETTANVSLSFSGLSGDETEAHIHGPGARGVNGPILHTLPTGSFNRFQINLTSTQVASLKAGLLYLNVPSNNFPEGEIRGQLEFNPIDEATLFVGQAYHDFLSRQADPAGQAFWIGQIAQCGNDAACVQAKRIDVSNAFYYELEFQQTGAYAYRLYREAFGNNQPFPNPDTSNQTEARKLPSYAVFARDRARVVGGVNLAQGQQDLANLFVLRPEFLSKYPAGLDGPSFIDTVLNTVKNDLGVDLADQKPGLLTLFNSGGRGAVLYRLADDNLQTNPIGNRAFIDAEYNRAFVATQYFGYLRRDSDIGGFLFWLGQVNSAPLRDVAKQHAMVCSFTTSNEYQQRFSSVVTHSNGDCPQ